MVLMTWLPFYPVFPFIAHTYKVNKLGNHKLLLSYKEIHRQSFTDQTVQSGIVQLSAVSYWTVGTGAAQKGITVPSIWQPPQITQLAAGIWPNCGV